MADHEFFGTLSVSEAATAPDHVTRKGEVDTALAGKAATEHAHDVDDVTGLQAALDGKADDAHAHAISDVAGLAAALDGKADDAHAHTPGDVTGLDAYVDGRVEAIVDADGAIAALDTLRELAEALGNDPEFAATITGLISALEDRVDAVEAATGSGSYRANVGDGSTKVITVTHGLGTKDVGIEVVRNSDGQTVYPVPARPTVNTVVLDFGAGAAPSAGQYRVLIDKR